MEGPAGYRKPVGIQMGMPWAEDPLTLDRKAKGLLLALAYQALLPLDPVAKKRQEVELKMDGGQVIVRPVIDEA